MPPWRSHIYLKEGRAAGVDQEIIARAVLSARLLHMRSPTAPPIFTLKHLSHLTGVSYSFLRSCVERSQPEPYRLFRIRKRQLSIESKQRYRIISVPSPQLMAVQRWINREILLKQNAHPASVAFAKGNNIRDAAALHCGCRWLIKLDILNFFESISEQNIYKVFNRMGYQRLIAFELARLCTRAGKRSRIRNSERWHARSYRYGTIPAYQKSLLGHLPQGAPTSPILSNLAMREFDDAIMKIADKHSMVYTRYADDIALSTADTHFSKLLAKDIIASIYKTMREYGFEPNLVKTKIVPPGGRKIILGLLVNGNEPHLTKAYRDIVRQHLHFMTRDDVGPVQHASAKGFASVYGLRNHVRGLIAHASHVDKQFAEFAWEQFNRVRWP